MGFLLCLFVCFGEAFCSSRVFNQKLWFLELLERNINDRVSYMCVLTEFQQNLGLREVLLFTSLSFSLRKIGFTFEKQPLMHRINHFLHNWEISQNYRSQMSEIDCISRKIKSYQFSVICASGGNPEAENSSGTSIHCSFTWSFLRLFFFFFF